MKRCNLIIEKEVGMIKNLNILPIEMIRFGSSRDIMCEFHISFDQTEISKLISDKNVKT